MERKDKHPGQAGRAVYLEDLGRSKSVNLDNRQLLTTDDKIRRKTKKKGRGSAF